MAQFLRSPRAVRNFPVQFPTELHRALGQVALGLLVRCDEELIDERVRQPCRHGHFGRVLSDTRLRLLLLLACRPYEVRGRGRGRKKNSLCGWWTTRVPAPARASRSAYMCGSATLDGAPFFRSLVNEVHRGPQKKTLTSSLWISHGGGVDARSNPVIVSKTTFE